jgi:hypothetical protein
VMKNASASLLHPLACCRVMNCRPAPKTNPEPSLTQQTAFSVT